MTNGCMLRLRHCYKKQFNALVDYAIQKLQDLME